MADKYFWNTSEIESWQRNTFGILRSGIPEDLPSCHSLIPASKNGGGGSEVGAAQAAAAAEAAAGGRGADQAEAEAARGR